MRQAVTRAQYMRSDGWSNAWSRTTKGRRFLVADPVRTG